MKNLNFRAWHKEKNRMYRVDGIMHYDQGTQIIVDGDISLNLDEVILMQSTGLKDSKGVEIFEGDVVLEEYGVGYESKQYPSFESNTQLKTKELVEIKDGIIRPNFGECSDDNFYKVFTVIGNIYEHPEILGVRK